MRVGIYANTGNPLVSALMAGFSSIGVEAQSRATTYYQGKVEPFDLIVVYGTRPTLGARVLADYKCPSVVFELGYLRRAQSQHDGGYFQFGLGGLNHVPMFDCPTDRLETLGLDIAERGGDPNGYVLVCGQVPGDAAHGQDSGTHRLWLREQLDHYENAIYRPHPRGGIAVPGCNADHRPLAESLAGARLVVTYNSNTGHDALLAGVPVVAHGPAAYSELSGEKLPSLEARRKYFSRVAYGQWMVDEMRDGTCQRFLIDHLVPGVSFPVADDAATSANMENVVEKRAPKRRGRKPKAQS